MYGSHFHASRARSATALVLNFHVLGWYTCVPSFMLIFASSAITDIAQLITMHWWFSVSLIGQMSCDHTFQCSVWRQIYQYKSMTAKFVAPLSPKFRGIGNHIWKSLPRPLRARSAMALVLNFFVLGWYTCVPSFMLLPQSARLVQLSAGLKVEYTSHWIATYW